MPKQVEETAAAPAFLSQKVTEPPGTRKGSVAILCPGPSFDPKKVPQGCETIGVNGLVSVYECDWWVFHDGAAARYFTPLGNPVACPRMARFWWSKFPKIRGGRGWTVGLAVELAIWLGYTDIPLYGMTMAGSGHCYPPAYEGESATSAYGLGCRWQSEAKRFRELAANAWEQHGATLTRMED